MPRLLGPDDPRRPTTEDLAVERLKALKKGKRVPKEQPGNMARPLPEVRRAVRTGQPITKAEEAALRIASGRTSTKPVDPSQFDAIKDNLKMRAPKSAQDEDEEDEAPDQPSEEELVEEGDTGTEPTPQQDVSEGQELEEEEAEEPPAMELAPTGVDHEAFSTHDNAIAESHKALRVANEAKSIPVKGEASIALYDAARGHKGAAREFDALATHIDGQEGQKGAPQARRVSKAHSKAAAAIEKAAISVNKDDISAADDTIRDADDAANDLTAVLRDNSRDEAIRLLARAMRRHPTALEFRDWTEWDRNHRKGFAKALRDQAKAIRDNPEGRHYAGTKETLPKDQAIQHAEGLEKAAMMVDAGASDNQIHQAAEMELGNDRVQASKAMHAAAGEFHAEEEMVPEEFKQTHYAPFHPPRPALPKPGHISEGLAGAPSARDDTRDWAEWDAEHKVMGGVHKALSSDARERHPTHFKKGYARGLAEGRRNPENAEKMAGQMHAAASVESDEQESARLQGMATGYLQASRERVPSFSRHDLHRLRLRLLTER